MSPEDIEDHPLLLQKIIAAIRADRGFIALPSPSPDARVEFTALYNFDIDRYRVALDNDEKVRPSKNEYGHLHTILASVISNPAPLLTYNISPDHMMGSLTPWRPRSVMVLPLPDEAHADALLWCDQMMTPGANAWTAESLVQVATLVYEFYAPSEQDSEPEPRRKRWRKITRQD